MSKTIKPFQRAHRAAGLHSAMAATAGVLMNRTASEVRRSWLPAWRSVALITPREDQHLWRHLHIGHAVRSCVLHPSTALSAVCANAKLLLSVPCRRAPLLRAWEQQRAWERRCWASTPPRRRRRRRAPAPTWRRWRRAGRGRTPPSGSPQSSSSTNPYSSCCGRRRGRPSTCWRRAAAPSSGPSASRRARRAACARAACLQGGVCATAAKQLALIERRPGSAPANSQSCGGPSTASAGAAEGSSSMPGLRRTPR